MKRYITTLLCIFFSFNASLYAEYSLTLSEALKCALANNELINAAAKTKEVSEYHLKSARGKHYPNVYVEGSVNKINDSISLNLNDAYKIPLSFNESLSLFKTSSISDEGTCKSDADAQIPSN